MPTSLEERVAYLEGKVEEHSYAWQDLKEAIRETNQRITNMEQKFDQRFTQIDQRFIQIDQRIANMEQKFDQRFTQIDQRIDKLFFFILATLASSIGALISALVSIFVR
jgi:predicted  nucleic acid-binding Zn-ribbon protein